MNLFIYSLLRFECSSFHTFTTVSKYYFSVGKKVLLFIQLNRQFISAIKGEVEEKAGRVQSRRLRFFPFHLFLCHLLKGFPAEVILIPGIVQSG